MHHHASQQQLAALLAAALPSSPDAPPDEISRVAALSSLHRTILHPSALLLLHRSSSFLCQALLQLLSDKSHAIRQAAAVAYGALGAVTASSQSSTGAPADRFLGWALPLVSPVNSNSEDAEIALVGLHEFITSGETPASERFISSVLRACQALLEDEGTSLHLLRPLLGILTVLASRFTHIFQPHFADLVDLLLGWALMPDLSESDRCLITDSFLQFQNFWAGNLPFSLNLLSKFLGDMEVLAHDAAPGTSSQLRRLLALASCFVAVLQATSSGIVEAGLAEEAVQSFTKLLPRLLACLGMVGQKFRTFKWLKEASTCLSLFANILKERFCDFSYLATDFLLKSVGQDDFQEMSQQGNIIAFATPPCFSVLTSIQVQLLLKINLELLSVQGSRLPLSVVCKLLQVGSFFSCLRLHPSRAVTGVVSATYLSLLKHDSEHIAHKAIDCLFNELNSLKCCLCNTIRKRDKHLHMVLVEGESQENAKRSLSEIEARELMKFDLTALTCSVYLKGEALSGLKLEEGSDILKAKNIIHFLLDKLNPFENPLQYYADVQFVLVQTMHRLCSIEATKGLSVPVRFEEVPVDNMGTKGEGNFRAAVLDCLSSCGQIIAKALDASASLPVKMEALDWLRTLSSVVTASYDYSSSLVQIDSPLQDLKDNEAAAPGNFGVSKDLMSALLAAALDKEQKVRGRVATTIELLLHARLITVLYLKDVAEVALEQLGDPDSSSQNAFRQVLSIVAPASLWTIGWTRNVSHSNSQLRATSLTVDLVHRRWKQIFSLKQFSKHLRPQQFVFVLNYIAQRWQVLPSFWLQRLIHNFPGNFLASSKTVGKELLSIQEPGSANSCKVNSSSIALNLDFELLERVCASSNLASAWWVIQEAARHCIAVRLRTHLGGPSQTFGALERMLLEVVRSLQADNGQRETGSAVVMQNVQLLPMWLLLEFVEALKKNIYNAYEGTVVLPTPPVASVHFFRANRKVCEDWFAHICEALMNASMALQCHAATFHHAVLRLQDLRGVAASTLRELPWPQMTDSTPSVKVKVQQDVLRTLQHGSLALCRGHEADMILGLKIWTTSTFGALLSDDASSVHKTGGVFSSLGWMDGLALQAQGQYERAAAYFVLLLQSDEALSALGADGVQFIIARTIESYVAIADWDALETWLQELQALRARHAGKAYAGALTTAGHDMNAIHALACFDSGDVQGAWGHLDLTPQSSGDLTPDPRQALQRSEQMLLQALLRPVVGTDEIIGKEIEKAKSMLEEALLVSGFDGLTQAAPLAMQLHCIKVFEAKHGSAGLRENNLSPNLALLNPLQQASCLSLDALHQDCLLWLKLLRVYKSVIPAAHVTFRLQWHLIRLARKQCNFRLSHRLLKQLRDLEPSGLQSGEDQFFEDSFAGFEYERILLVYAEEKNQEAITALWRLVQSYLNLPKTSADNQVMKAKACLKFASWLKKQPILPGYFSSRLNVESKDDVEGGTSIFAEGDNIMPREVSRFPAQNFEELVGTAVKSATLLCPNMGKAWYAYATWCYHHGKLSFSGSSALNYRHSFPQILDSEFPLNGSTFSENEVEGIRAILLDASYLAEPWKDTEGQMRAASYEAFVQHTIYLMQMAAGAVGGEHSDGESPSGMLSLQLKQELLAVSHSMTVSHAITYVTKLMEIWWTLRKRRASLYGYAVQGFLKYLSLSNWTEQRKTISDKRGMRGVKQQREDHVLSSSLYVLHILFNHGVELEDSIQKGLASVPPMPWQEITAQLFARLSSHPEPQVRRQLEGLLMTLAHSSPWAIVYPTLVNLNTSDGEPLAELQRLLGCLKSLHPKLVKDVRLLIAELEGITVLWEEQWLSTLQDLHSDAIRRIALLKDEALRIADNNSLISVEKPRIDAARYSEMMAPIIASLERRLAITSRPPETAHEAWFQEQYGFQLQTAISTFKTPPTSIASISDVWRPFDAIVASLANQPKKSVVLLADVAPRLAALSSSHVPIPGLKQQVNGMADGARIQNPDLPEIVTVTAFDKQVHILATKTKPKKLTMVGSDGQSYTYLLKGHEDLRLDARIMQLLHVVNGMLCSNRSTKGPGLSARYYSVTPISGRAGLIQWVDNLTSMYAVFKAWQQRNQAMQLATSGANSASQSVPVAVPRPSDMFYGKLLPALKERGLRKVSSRRDWPQEVKRKVLLELMKETPRQLLYREIWCASDGFTTFSSKLQRFSGSVAVMSMVGHILGLGDRHLDNILMDFNTGDILHIDYNVCFDKGLRLKIPEIVPFRLTQTIQAALGVTGIEGAFKSSCEQVLETLQKNKDLILMLLEVFVWDPLMEWTRGDGHEGTVIGEEERKGMDLAVGSSLFGSRLQETWLPMQAAESVVESQDTRSQEDLVTTGLAEESSSGADPLKGTFEQLAELGDKLGESLDEGILSQDEDDCWISPPNSGLTSSLDREVQNPLVESFWLQSAESLSGPRIWQSSLAAEVQQKKASNAAIQARSTIVIREEKQNTSPLQLHSQGDAAFLDEGNAHILTTLHSKEGSKTHDVLQTSLSSDRVAFHSPNKILMGPLDAIGASSELPDGIRTHTDIREKQELSLQGKSYMGSDGDSNNYVHATSAASNGGAQRPSRKKNTYAVSVLKKVELKLDGFDIDSRRQFTVAEQVDHLLRQAMSIDNLCNMYEGWTPWI